MIENTSTMIYIQCHVVHRLRPMNHEGVVGEAAVAQSHGRAFRFPGSGPGNSNRRFPTP